MRYGFHVRSYPVISASASNGWGTSALPPLRVAYIGHWAGNWEGATQLPTGLEVASSPKERGDLDALRITFKNTLYKPGNGILPAVEGDVYADYNQPGADDADGPGLESEAYLYKSLFWGPTPRIDQYHVVVLGSDMDPKWLGEGAWDVADEFAAWVNKGNLLFVLGTDADDVDWLKVVLGANTGKDAPGNLTTPDDSHAFLTTPNRLDVSGYAGFVAEEAWNLGEVDETFTIVIGDKKGTATVLGLSNDGMYQKEGAVFLTSIQPGEVPDREEARKLLANALVYKFLRSTYIDYGPGMDAHALARSATRIVPIETLSGATIDAKVVLFMWRAG